MFGAFDPKPSTLRGLSPQEQAFWKAQKEYEAKVVYV